MITFNGLDLFSSGPSITKAGPLESRDAVAASAGSIGASVTGQGIAPRTITQLGTLVADNEPALRQLADAIQAVVGTSDATLSDEFGNDWPACVMRAFKPEPTHRIGPRMAMRYTITYLQTHP